MFTILHFKNEEKCFFINIIYNKVIQKFNYCVFINYIFDSLKKKQLKMVKCS